MDQFEHSLIETYFDSQTKIELKGHFNIAHNDVLSPKEHNSIFYFKNLVFELSGIIFTLKIYRYSIDNDNRMNFYIIYISEL